MVLCSFVGSCFGGHEETNSSLGLSHISKVWSIVRKRIGHQVRPKHVGSGHTWVGPGRATVRFVIGGDRDKQKRATSPRPRVSPCEVGSQCLPACARPPARKTATLRTQPPKLVGWLVGVRVRQRRGFANAICVCNDPSAGSPTETLLRLLLPLNDKVR